jgi:hypothetical protein
MLSKKSPDCGWKTYAAPEVSKLGGQRRDDFIAGAATAAGVCVILVAELDPDGCGIAWLSSATTLGCALVASAGAGTGIGGAAAIGANGSEAGTDATAGQDETRAAG